MWHYHYIAEVNEASIVVRSAQKMEHAKDGALVASPALSFYCII
jgi:hypothetical protein